MKKILTSLVIMGTLLFNTNNVFSQKIRFVNPTEVPRIELIQSNETYQERVNKLESVKYSDPKGMLDEVRDVRDAEIYCSKIMKHAGANADKYDYGEVDYWGSFEQSYYLRSQDCDDATIAAASVLYDNGFKPYFLSLETKNGDSGHLVFLYKDQKGRFGTIGINETDCKKPKHKSLKDLINEFGQEDNEDYSGTHTGVLDATAIFPDAIYKKQNYLKYLTQ